MDNNVLKGVESQTYTLHRGRRLSSSYNSIVAGLQEENGKNKETLFIICFYLCLFVID